MFFEHQRQPTNGCRRVYPLSSASAAAGTSACMTCMVRTVLTIYVRQAQVHLSRLSLSATKTSLSKLLLHCHPSDCRDHQVCHHVCPALDAPCPPPGDGHLQAGLMAVSTHTKATFDDPPFFPYMVQAGVAERPPVPWVFVGALVPE